MTDKETAAAEPVMIEAIYGPYRGNRLSVPPEVADQGIEDGWARDPFAAPGGPVRTLTPEEEVAAIDAAHRAGRKLRGEETDEDKAVESEEGGGKRRKPAASKTREMEPGEPGKPYTTRDAKPA